MNDMNWCDLTDHQKAGVITAGVLVLAGLAFIVPKIVLGVVATAVVYMRAYMVLELL